MTAGIAGRSDPVPALRAAASASALAAVAGLALVCGCTSASLGPGDREARPSASPGAPTASLLADATSRRGIRFVHHQSRKGKVAFLPETLGPGVASLDYDGDGFQDLFFVQGSGDTDAQDPAQAPPCELYRSAGPGAPMEEVAARASAQARGWGQAALAADLDGDGYPDLVVTSYRQPPRVLWNEGDGTFSSAGPETGLPGGDRWWSFAAAIDYDQDGLLDLYLGAYVNFGPKDFTDHPATVDYGFGPMPVTMVPRPWRPEPKALLRNLGGRRWADVTTSMHMSNPGGRGLAALVADLDGDGWPDIFVANDVSPNALFHGTGGVLDDIAQKAWVGEARGSMGLATEDTDGDGTLDILCSHWVGDVPALYRAAVSKRRLAYRDDAERAGLGSLPRDMVGWAVGFIDCANRGADDILIIHGHTNAAPGKPGVLEPQPAILLRAVGDGSFAVRAPVPDGPDAIDHPRVGRGAAFTDLDNKGRPMIAVGVNNGPAEIWRCVPPAGHWIGLDLVATQGNREAIGARITLEAKPHSRLKARTSGESFFSTCDRRVLYGLGTRQDPVGVTVLWGARAPSAAGDARDAREAPDERVRRETFAGLAVDRYHRLVEGTGQPAR